MSENTFLNKGHKWKGTARKTWATREYTILENYFARTKFAIVAIKQWNSSHVLTMPQWINRVGCTIIIYKHIRRCMVEKPQNGRWSNGINMRVVFHSRSDISGVNIVGRLDEVQYLKKPLELECFLRRLKMCLFQQIFTQYHAQFSRATHYYLLL